MASIKLNDFQAYRLYEFLKGQANKGVPHWRRNVRLHDAWNIEAIEDAINENNRKQREFLAAIRDWEGAGKQGPPPREPALHEFRSDAKPVARETDSADLEFLNRAVGEWDKEDLPASTNQQSGLPADASKLGEIYLGIFDAVKAAWDARAQADQAAKTLAKQSSRKLKQIGARA